MRVLIAGASGVIGRQLTPMLQEEGHDVVGLARAAFPSSARVVQADALDLDAVVRVVSETRPDVIVNMLTAIPGQLDPKRFAEQLELTNRLRIQGTSNLITAAAEVGVRQFLSQGLAFAYDPGGEGPASEDAPLFAGARRVPTFLARWAIGPWGVAFMTALRGAANDRARRILGWQPAFASWRTGFTAELRSTAR
ncbi:NAD-dependent epimerase/dehydratase family protein [Pseudactinotalea sp. Z1739]|uniref:NAD-dependent epimerase/dehydratase family protein n=1 Tax=Pseudactinotalea sp. Z1739 TaxID=3413028 RepID=UPI003C7C6EAB